MISEAYSVSVTCLLYIFHWITRGHEFIRYPFLLFPDVHIFVNAYMSIFICIYICIYMSLWKYVCLCVCWEGMECRWAGQHLTLVKSTDTNSYIFLGFIPVLALVLTSHADLAKLWKLTDSQWSHLKIGIIKPQPHSFAVTTELMNVQNLIQFLYPVNTQQVIPQA